MGSWSLTCAWVWAQYGICSSTWRSEIPHLSQTCNQHCCHNFWAVFLILSVSSFHWLSLITGRIPGSATYLIGSEGSPASHQSLGGLMYMHHNSQLYPWAEFSYRCTSKLSCLILSMEGRITLFRFSWIRERTGSALRGKKGGIRKGALTAVPI